MSQRKERLAYLLFLCWVLLKSLSFECSFFIYFLLEKNGDLSLFRLIQKCLHQEWVDCLGGHGSQDKHTMLYSIYFPNENKERVAI